MADTRANAVHQNLREKGMRNLAAVLARASVATIIAVAVLIGVGLSGAVVISSLMGRVAKLESDLRKAQDRIVELAASQSRLNASIDAADRSIKSLRSDLDHPRIQPLTSILDGGAVK